MSTFLLEGDEWEFVSCHSYDCQVAKHHLGTFSDTIIAFKITSQYANPLWKKAGSIGQAFRLPIGEDAFWDQEDFNLGKFYVREYLPPLGSTYDLYYFPPLRLGTVKITIYSYKGKTKDRLAETLVIVDRNRQAITELRNEIDDLKIGILILMALYTELLQNLGGGGTSTPIAANVEASYSKGNITDLYLACNSNLARSGLIVKNVSGNGTAIRIGWNGELKTDTERASIVNIPDGYTYSFDFRYTGELYVMPVADEFGIIQPANILIIEIGSNSNPNPVLDVS